jgi:hypothetical protein
MMKILQSTEKLLHVALDLGYGDAHIGIVQQSREVVVHVWKDHIQDGFDLWTG